jgi:hypothetical protein
VVVRRSRIVLLLAATGACHVAGPVSAASTEHRAAVIVDTGTTVKRVCVRFTEDSISGKEALDRAGVDPVYRSYGGSLGSAVCSLCGVGRSYADCLGSGASATYWAYWRAAAGATSFTRSSFGVSSTRVRDGDVEGWRWGVSEAPPFALVTEVCGPEPSPEPSPAPTTAPTAASPGRSPASRPPATPARPPAASAATPATAAPPTSTPEAAPTRAAARAGPTDGEQGLEAGRPVAPDRAAGPDGSLLVFGALLAGLVGSIAVARHRRGTRPGAPR